MNTVSTKSNDPEKEDLNRKRYLDFFNQEVADVASLTDEELKDRIILYGETLFEVKVKQQTSIEQLQIRAATKKKSEKEKLRLSDLTYNPAQPFDSPIDEVKKRQTKLKTADDAMRKLGLNTEEIEILKAKFKVQKRKTEEVKTFGEQKEHDQVTGLVKTEEVKPEPDKPKTIIKKLDFGKK